MHTLDIAPLSSESPPQKRFIKFMNGEPFKTVVLEDNCGRFLPQVVKIGIPLQKR